MNLNGKNVLAMDVNNLFINLLKSISNNSIYSWKRSIAVNA